MLTRFTAKIISGEMPNITECALILLGALIGAVIVLSSIKPLFAGIVVVAGVMEAIK